MRTMSGSPCLYDCANKNSFGYCKTTSCINPKYSNIGTAQYGQGVQMRTFTNADRIRTMSDEELAENLMKVYDCPKGKECVEQMPGEDGFQQCKRCWVEWLRQECE